MTQAPPSAPWYLPCRPLTTLAVLGGSSPFVLALVTAIAARPPWPEGTLRLHGRDLAALGVVHRCAEHLLARSGWRADAVTDLGAALDAADVVLHQNRYGGLDARAEDEVLASSLGLPPDETLGPAGLLTALRTAHGQRRYADALRGTSSRAVLTMTNPLGVSTAALAAAGVPVLGLCELPEVTRRGIAHLLGVAPARLTGDYAGFNHRGFWHGLRVDGEDVMPRVASALASGERALSWTDAGTVQELGAVPDKYHSLLAGRGVLRPGRAAELAAVRDRLLAEAAAAPEAVPASLAARDMPWYEVVVLPVLRALAGDPTTVVVTRTGPDGTAAEHQVELEGDAVRELPGAEPPPAVAALLERFARHERAVLAAAVAPDVDGARVREALALDPTVPSRLVAPATRGVLACWERQVAA